jgi:hypothetical protein
VRLAAFVAAACCALFLPAGASAQTGPENPERTPAPSLEVECAGLDVAETERLLRVELAVIAARVERARAPSVRIQCKRGVLYIEVEDPASGGKKALTLPAPGPKTSDRERTVAIAASQLFLSSWLEMITGKKPETTPQPAPKAPPPSPPRPLSVADTAPIPPPDEHGWELVATGALRFRHLGAAVRTFAPSLALRRRFGGRWLAQGELGVETAQTRRASGDVDWLAGRAGGGFGVRLGDAPFALDALASASLVIVRAAGEPELDGVRGEESSAGALDLAIGIVPELCISRFCLGVLGEAGLLYPELTGRVARDRPSSLHGPWAGVGVVIGGEIVP